MKKHLSFLVFSAFILSIAIFTSCDKKNDNDNPVIPDPGIFTTECGRVEINSEEYIQMCIVPDIVTANSTNKYRIENLSTKDLNYGTGFRLEYFDNNNWVEVDLSSLIPTGLLITTKAGEISEENFNIYEIVEKFNDAKVGKYRIIKDFNVPYPFATPEYSIPAEFIVFSENPDNPDDPSNGIISLENFNYEPCSNSKGATDFFEDYIKLKAVNENTLHIEQEITMNCCTDSVTLTIIPDNKTVTLNMNNYGNGCNCICPAHVSCDITGLLENTTYLFIFIRNKDEYYRVSITFTADLEEIINL